MTSAAPTQARATGPETAPAAPAADAGAELLTAATYDLVEELSEAGVELSVKEGRLAFKAPPGRLTDALKERIREQKEALLALLGPDESVRARARTLPLSELQQSYWLGEAGTQGIAGAGCWYNGFSVETLDLERLQAALTALFTRHDALRMTVGPDGRGRLLEHVGPFPLEYQDLRALPAADVARELERTRAAMSRPRSGAEVWPLYRMCVQRTAERFHVHVEGRLLVGDATSWFLYVEELRKLLEDPARTDLPAPGRLASLVLRRFRQLVSADYQRARQYWAGRAIPPSPALPVRTLAEGGGRIRRLIADLPEAEATVLTARAREFGLTLDNALMGAFALVLAEWAQTPDFSINVLHGGGRHLGLPLGHFGGIVRLELNVRRDASFADLAGAIRQRLALDMGHASVDGVTVQRIAARQSGTPVRAGVVAYSSGLALGRSDTEIGLAQLGWKPEGASIQSPGVLIDQQVFRTRDGLRFHWDIDADTLCPGVGEAMFDTFLAGVRRLAEAHDWKTPLRMALPPAQQASQARANATSAERSVHRLHSLLERQVRGNPGTAVVTRERTLSFQELGQRASGVANALRARGAKPDVPVAIVANKGWEQVVAALGTALAGAPYVPLDPSWPSARLSAVLTAADVGMALCDAAGAEALAREGGGTALVSLRIDEVPLASVDAVGPDAGRLAYILFTSGSTGEPKGVAISHDAVANTLEDIQRRFGVGPEDCVLGVSHLHFDLSVFDLFGVLGAGGRLVLPPPASHPDPAELFPLVQEHRVTVWNTVPAIMEMLVEYMEARGLQAPSLRLALLSGDWIPVTLPGRIRAVFPNARVVSLGGATEASIWSNAFEVRDVPATWSSIPYGFPLANQQLWVLHPGVGNPCPDWVEGELAIAGQGLAEGYWRSPEKTAEAFVTHPETGLRLYLTGDRARRWPDGNIEFLGRTDGQVKISGYRVELGDVTAALTKSQAVDKAVVVAVGPREHRWLAAFITPTGAERPELRDTLSALLPSYMVPRRIHWLPELPLTANGKVDQAKLRELALLDQPVTLAPRTSAEHLMAELWSQILGRPIRDTQVSFFEVGGESVLAVRLANAIEHRTGVRPELAELLRTATIEGMARVMGGQRGGAHSALVRMQRGAEGAPTVVCIHPVGGTVYCYRELVDLLGKRFTVVGLQSLGLERGDLSLRDLAAHYVEQLDGAGLKPDVLFGWSLGGAVALEVQRRLEARGTRRVAAVLVDPWVRKPAASKPEMKALEAAFIRDVLRGAGTLSLEALAERLRTRSLPEVVQSLGGEGLAQRARGSELAALFEQFRQNTSALLGYDPPDGPVDADVWFADAQRPEDFPHLQPLDQCRQVPRVHRVPADHYGIMEGDALKRIAAALRSRFEVTQEAAS
ncbi:amino acid adenylation domain-containing protein [Corallococcus exercitus]|uniref:Amino acid adenylation domain-containing protein n=1 Tax=Corallococcus exercitus TaxID=2316736 RepID=A0A7Y4KEY4_9BACT|nr:non-ribosomal peptide synthetase [Corallococcus exercitus]NOK32040.1 amino acid adenylation domain-containing protein [Corallococcus exercitus]